MRRRESATQPSTNPDPEDFLPLPTLPYQILVAVSEEARHGWGIVKRIGELAGDRAKPSSGSLYLAIAKLEERGLIEAADNAPAEAGRGQAYRPTTLGRRVLQLETARLADLVRQANRALGTPRPDAPRSRP